MAVGVTGVMEVVHRAARGRLGESAVPGALSEPRD